MVTVTLELPDVFTIESREREVDADIAALAANPEVVKRATLYGLNAAVSDAGNGAPDAAAREAIGDRPKEKDKIAAWEKKIAAWKKDPANKETIADKTEELMAARLANFLKGLWSVRGTGGLSRRDRILDGIVRSVAKSSLGEDWAKFEALDEAAQSAKVKEWYEGNKEAFDLAVDKRIAELDAKRQERAGLQDATKGKISL